MLLKVYDYVHILYIKKFVRIRLQRYKLDMHLVICRCLNINARKLSHVHTDTYIKKYLLLLFFMSEPECLNIYIYWCQYVRT